MSNELKDTPASNAPMTSDEARERELGWDPVRALAIYNTNTQPLLGKVLTVIDAIIPPGQQNKATKDTIKEHFRTQHHWARVACQVKEDAHQWPAPYDPPSVD